MKLPNKPAIFDEQVVLANGAVVRVNGVLCGEEYEHRSAVNFCISFTASHHIDDAHHERQALTETKVSIGFDALEADKIIAFLTECLKHKDWKWPEPERDELLEAAISKGKRLYPDLVWDRIAVEGRYAAVWGLHPELMT